MKSVLPSTSFVNLHAHPEFASCLEAMEAGDGKRRGTLFAYRVAQFTMSICDEDREILAVAAGYVSHPGNATTANPSPNLSPWGPYFGLPKVVFFDVTEDHTGNWPPVNGAAAFPMIKVGLISNVGAPSAPADPMAEYPTPVDQGLAGHAISIAAHTYGGGPPSEKTFVFVADLTGRVLVFECTEQSFGITCSPAVHEAVDVPANALQPVSSWPDPADVRARLFPDEDYDGVATNTIDLDLRFPYLYVAATRQGVKVLDISDPYALVEATAAQAADLSTPGFATGVTVREVNEVPTLLVGDQQGGVRLYEE